MVRRQAVEDPAYHSSLGDPDFLERSRAGHNLQDLVFGEPRLQIAVIFANDVSPATRSVNLEGIQLRG